MRILLLTHSFNSLTQRLHVELSREGHELAVEFDINDQTSLEAVRLFRPHLIIAPFLKRRIPKAIWSKHVCLIVHPGIPGDGGPSALDRAILRNEDRWGVTVFQATGELDAGPVWAWRQFAMRAAAKSSIYRFEVTEAAIAALKQALQRFQDCTFIPRLASELDGVRTGTWHDPLRQRDRRIDWKTDDTETVIRKIRSADGRPGVRDEMAGLPCRLYNVHREMSLRGRPGELIARRHYAVCKATVDGAVWITHLREEGEDTFKLPATHVLGKRIAHLPNVGLPFYVQPRRDTWQDIRYREKGDVGFLHFDFYNGAMSTSACRRLLTAFDHARSRDTRVIVLTGGRDFWSNGLDLNTIEAASSPANESWRNINAMDDLCEAIIGTTSHLTVAALRGNAGAGGCFLALATDSVIARPGVVLNPHYKNMGNLYGSEFWTYLVPLRTDEGAREALLANRLPLGAREALNYGLIDLIASSDPLQFDRDVIEAAEELTRGHKLERMLEAKLKRRQRDEITKPLAAYRAAELDHMRLNFYGFDPSYHVARHRFVHHAPHAWTPLYLAPHRRLDWSIPTDGDARAIA